MNKKKLENKILNSVKKRNGGHLPDERQQLFNLTVVASALVFGIAFDSIMMIYYFVTKNIEKAYPYVLQLIVMCIGAELASLGNKDAQPPTVLFSRRSVNTDKNVYAFLSRLAWYMLDSLIFAVLLTACDAYTDGKVTGSLITDGILSFCIIVMIESISCEIKVRRYRKHMEI